MKTRKYIEGSIGLVVCFFVFVLPFIFIALDGGEVQTGSRVDAIYFARENSVVG